MFNRKCHSEGEAIKVYNEVVVICKCLTVKDVAALFEAGRAQGLKEIKNV